jgi:hypothetical protein
MEKVNLIKIYYKHMSQCNPLYNYYMLIISKKSEATLIHSSIVGHLSCFHSRNRRGFMNKVPYMHV